MNRGYPPSPYRSAPPPRRPQRHMNEFVPANVLMQLVAQSQKRYAFIREAAMKQDAGYEQLQMDSQNIAIALERDNPEALQMLEEGLAMVLQIAQANRYLLDQQMQGERMLQGALKRFLMGQPIAPGQEGPPEMEGRGNPYRAPQLGQGGPASPQPPQGMQQAPQIPVGADLRDPAAAAAVYARAEQMPLGALPMAPQQLAPQQMQPQQMMPQQMMPQQGPQPLQPYMQYTVPPQQPMPSSPQYPMPMPSSPQGMQPLAQMNLPLQPTYGPVTMPGTAAPVTVENVVAGQAPQAASPVNGAAKTAS